MNRYILPRQFMEDTDCLISVAVDNYKLCIMSDPGDGG